MAGEMEVDDGVPGTDDRGRMTGAWLLVVGATGRSPRRSLRSLRMTGLCVILSDGEESRRWRSGFFGRCAPSE